MEIEPVQVRQPSSAARYSPAFWGVAVLIWFAILCVVPDPRPLGAPDLAVAVVRKLTGVPDSAARAATAFALRFGGLAILAFLVTLCFGSRPARWAAPLAGAASFVLAIAAMWANYGYFPISFQLQLALVATLVGVLAAIATRKSLAAKVIFALTLGGLFLWAVPTGISNDLDRSARIIGTGVLENVEMVPKGDEGFQRTMEIAFLYAQQNSAASDPVHANKAAIVALGVILGDNRVADVALRTLDKSNQPIFNQFRGKVTLRGRSDLPRHFWVSAALTILADGNRSVAVGVTKELMDSNPGGSGFSFVDLAADGAGVLFAEAATKDAESARRVQQAIIDGLTADDFCPPIDGLPEGIPRDEFDSDYGGLGGEETTRLVEEIERRLAACRGLWVESIDSVDILADSDVQ